MAFIPVADTAMVEVRFRLHSQRIENTLYFKFGGAVSQSDLDGLTAAISTWVTSKYLQMLTSSQSLVYVENYATLLTTATGYTSTNTTGTGATGQTAGAGLPGSVCLAVSFRTAERGRSGRGRNYVSGWATGAVSGNQFTSASAGYAVATYQDLITSPITGWTWVVVSRFTAGAPRVNGVTLPITNVVVTDLNVDSQRRRLTGRGL